MSSTKAWQPRHRSASRHERGLSIPPLPTLAVIGLLSASIILGGGGSPNPATEMVLQLVAVAATIVFVITHPRTDGSPSRGIVALAVLTAVLPVIQLIPLPPSVWQSLPEREAAHAALVVAGAGDAWMPISLVRPATVAALLSLGPPLALMLMVAALPIDQRGWLLWIVAGLGIVSVLMGTAQLAGGGDTARLYRETHTGWITGFQANRNATADIFLIALLAVAGIVAGERSHRARAPSARWWMFGAMAMLVLGLVLTGSRGGILLLVPVLFFAVYAVGGFTAFGVRGLLVAVGGIVVAAAAGWLAFTRVAVLQGVAARFDVRSDFRSELWQDGWQAAMAYWPVGGGMGAFPRLFVPFERLEVVDRTAPNRAHNDYLELLIESGAMGVVVLAIAVLTLAVIAFKAWRSTEVPRNHRLFSIGAIAVVAAHSLVDYPMRAMSLACLFALAVGLLAVPHRADVTNKGVDA